MVETRGGKKTRQNPTAEKAAKKRKPEPAAASVPVPPPPIVDGDTAGRSNAEERRREAAETAKHKPVEEKGDDLDDEVIESDEDGEEGEDEDGEEGEEEDGEEGEDEDGEEGEDEGSETAEESESDSGGRNADAWAVTEAMKPSRMYFPPDQYSKSIKLSTRCHVEEFLKTFNDLDPSPRERAWFEEHPQFRHILHMPKSNHMVQPMWMLLLRTAEIQRKKEAWFVLNGIPIRYGLREHAMISGLDCRNYPLDWKRKGSSSFKNKYFPEKKRKEKKKEKKKEKPKKILREDMRELLKKMGPDDTGDRLKMAVLYFLSSIVYCHTKSGPLAKPVLDIFVRYVDDLELCKTFPWGRFSFDQMLESIHSTMSHYDGKVSGDWTIPGFCLPLELLALEAIPELRTRFREPVPAPHNDCPRMCRSKWQKCDLRGWPLETVYEKLGKTKDIDSLLLASEEENEILNSITENEDDVDEHDPVVESWEERLHYGLTIEFQDMMEEDVNGRAKEKEETGGRASKKVTLAEVLAEVHSLIDHIGILSEKIEKLEDRIKPLEEYVKARKIIFDVV